jgi:G:T-mismatch repair DNA endonuclease (very short patch repair protein)
LNKLGWSVHVVWECTVRDGRFWQPLHAFLRRCDDCC